MPGHLGSVSRTIQNLTIVKVMSEENIMLVKGSIPGHNGSYVVIKPTEKKYTPKEIYSEKEHSQEAKLDVESAESNEAAQETNLNNDSQSDAGESSSSENVDKKTEE